MARVRYIDYCLSKDHTFNLKDHIKKLIEKYIISDNPRLGLLTLMELKPSFNLLPAPFCYSTCLYN